MTMRRLSDSQVRNIRKAHKAGVSIMKLSKLYHLNYKSMYVLVNRGTYRDVVDDVPEEYVGMVN